MVGGRWAAEIEWFNEQRSGNDGSVNGVSLQYLVHSCLRPRSCVGVTSGNQPRRTIPAGKDRPEAAEPREYFLFCLFVTVCG